MTASGDQPLAARLTLALGGTYTIEGEIGRGGMGVVYRARDERLQRRVAIKVLPPELAFQQEIRERFLREAQTAARLSHPHIVPIHDVGDAGGLVYFVMGYVDGESLGARIKRRGSLPTEEVRRIMKETADALSAAHGLSVIHRDIKPDNILLEGTRGRVMVTDFGIAKALSSASGATLTGAGIAIGTPSYMSPEQAAGERDIDGRSDLYSLGIVSFQMLTGELPFAAPTVAGILMKQITEPAPLVSALRPDVPEDLTLAVSRCLEKDPENRWTSADQLRRALEARTVSGYRPTGLGWKAATRQATAPAAAPRRTTPTAPSTGRPATARPLGGLPQPGPAPRQPVATGRAGAAARRGQWVRNERGEWVRAGEDIAASVPDTGEPVIIQRTRAQFARWAAVSGGLFLINIATGLDSPWFLFPAGGMAIPLLKSYAELWQAGYSWRDVLQRPPAADAVERTLGKGPAKLPRQLPPASADEYGRHAAAVNQAQGDRAAILKLVERLTPAEKQMLPEIIPTVEGLFQRATDVARTLHAMDSNLGTDDSAAFEQRVAVITAEPETEERNRRLSLLERQRQSYLELKGRRDQLAGNLDSCVLALQNVRFDLLRLRSAGVGAVMGDLTQATQQAKALSRDVDNAIAASAEIREAIGRG